jgi:hypothetical protein
MLRAIKSCEFWSGSGDECGGLGSGGGNVSGGVSGSGGGEELSREM